MPFVRTEEEILAKAPLVLKLGAKEYPVPVQGIRFTQNWRRQLAEQLSGVIDGFSAATSAEALTTGLAGALIQFPEKLTELLFAYAPSLPRDEVLDDATEEQISAAFSRVMAVAYPFLPQLAMVNQIRSQKPTPAAATRLQ